MTLDDRSIDYCTEMNVLHMKADPLIVLHCVNTTGYNNIVLYYHIDSKYQLVTLPLANVEFVSMMKSFKVADNILYVAVVEEVTESEVQQPNRLHVLEFHIDDDLAFSLKK